MRIGSLHLTNYRSYRDSTFEFGKQLTLLIGKNGMGKTNLITALHQVLSFIFAQKKNSPQYDYIASSDAKVTSFAQTDAAYGKNKLGIEDYIYPISLEAKAFLENEEMLEWQFLQSSNSSGLQASLYDNANNIFWDYYLHDIRNLPVLAYFSDSYPHVTSKIGRKMQEKLKSGKPLPPNTGYYKWDDEHHCTDIWILYYTMQKKNAIFENDKNKEDYVDSIEKKLVEFSQPLVKNVNDEFVITGLALEARGKEDVLVVKFADGRIIPFGELPQGYRRMISIAFDIASRSYLLNRNCNSSGIVFIDELELHLHPSLAQEILPRLMKVFPRIQFIASTHSPVVLSNIHNDEKTIIYRLAKEQNESVSNEIISEDYYGLDANNILEEAMLSYPLSSAVFKMIQETEGCINNRDLDKAQRILKAIASETSENHPVVLRLNALISRFKILGK